MPKKTRKNKVEMTVRLRLEPETANFLKNCKVYGSKCNVTSKAVEFYYNYLVYPKGFFIRLIESNFEVIKHLLRKIGRFRK